MRPPSGGVRFAPSPTGAFHVGNFRTAWISREWARLLGKPWIVRFEDIDVPRVVPGARERQLDEMRALGLVPGQVLVQSEAAERHWELFSRAGERGAVYPCYCSRKDVQEALASAASAPHGEPPAYSGRCRALKSGATPQTPPKGLSSIAWRFRGDSPDGSLDFIVARTSPPEGGAPDRESFVPSYHWACALDDFDGGYDLLVRAHDLAHGVAPQRAIQALAARITGVAASFAAVFHCSLIVQDDGHRLEKRTGGVTLPELARAGWDPERLAKCFRRSFTAKNERLEPGRVWGEEAEKITLSELLR